MLFAPDFGADLGAQLADRVMYAEGLGGPHNPQHENRRVPHGSLFLARSAFLIECRRVPHTSFLCFCGMKIPHSHCEFLLTFNILFM
jgi:hypothetical protein